MTLPPAFAEAQTKYATLRQLLAAGTMSEAQFQTALKSLMVLHQGRYWSMGAQTGLWHVNEGGAWRPAPPPMMPTAQPPPSWPPGPGPPPPRQGSPLPLVLGLLAGVVVLVLLIVGAKLFGSGLVRSLTHMAAASAPTITPTAPPSSVGSAPAPIGDGPMASGPSPPVTSPPSATPPANPPASTGDDGSGGAAITRTAREDGQSVQAQQVDASGRVTVEAATIHQMTCAGGRSIYVYEYADRPAFRAIQPPDWSTPLGGRDFASFGEAVSAGCAGG